MLHKSKKQHAETVEDGERGGRDERREESVPSLRVFGFLLTVCGIKRAFPAENISPP